MSSSGSDSDSCMTRATSTPMLHMTAPENINYYIKFKSIEKSKKKKFIYTLKMGQKLPYEPEIEGYKIKFDMDLKPSAGDCWSVEKEEKFWVFKEVFSASSISTTGRSIIDDLPMSSSAILSVTSSPATISVPLNLDSSMVSEDLDGSFLSPGGSKWTQEEAQQMFKLIEKINNNLCSFISGYLDNCYDHILEEHKDWRDETGRPVHGAELPAVVEVQGGPLADEQVQGSLYTRPEWKEEFRRDFSKIVVDKCSIATKEAIASNEDIKDIRKKKRVRKEIVDTVVEHLVEISGTVANPRLDSMRWIVVILGNNYPNMFQDKGSEEMQLGYGLGGRRGVKQLPEQLVDKVRHILDKKRTTFGSSGQQNEDLGAEEVPRKIGKRADAYGVDNRKFYSGQKDAVSYATIAKVSDELDYDAREKVFSEKREILQFQFRSSQNQIGKVCSSFFSCPGHLNGQFSWLTCVPNLKEKVDKNLKPQLGYLEKVLLYENQSLEFKAQIDNIDVMVETDYDGVSTYKDIQILRLAGTHLDSDGSQLFQFERELPHKSNSPFILAVELQSGVFVMELWADKSKLIGNLDLPTAITAFIQLCFVFNLRYPAESQTVADILQRRVCKYGDDSGSRTTSSKKTASSKMTKYLQSLGRVLTDD